MTWVKFIYAISFTLFCFVSDQIAVILFGVGIATVLILPTFAVVCALSAVVLCLINHLRKLVEKTNKSF